MIRTIWVFLFAGVWLWSADPLPSWQNGEVKSRIVAFVRDVTDPQSKGYIPPNERIAVFDNDGTMWPEYPRYFQLQFAIDTLPEVVKSQPKLRETMPYKAALEGDMDTLLSGDVTRHILLLLAATHTGMRDDAFKRRVREWVTQRRHPRFKRPYIDLVYRPMRELLRYLEANGFRVFIVSGGGIDFMRAFMPEHYGIPSERIVGSYAVTTFEEGEIRKTPKIAFVNDKENKPIAVYRHIGLRPVFACGNSDGDLAMLRYSARSRYPSLQLFIRHTDAEREYAYDRKSRIGTLDKGLDVAMREGWIVVDMKKDWRDIFSE